MTFVDLFDGLYSKVRDRNPYLKKARVYGLLRALIRLTANIIIPVLFKLTRRKREYSINSICADPRTVVSITTFPPRIKKVWLTIESILRQREKPDKIILWLSKEYFPSVELLPRTLIKLQERGLEIRLVEDDIRAHKKYLYAITQFPESNIITIDDDIIYPSFLVLKLLDFHKIFPQSIICHRALKIGVRGGELMPYHSWKLRMDITGESYDLFVTTGGGTLIPPRCFHPDIYNLSLIKTLTLNSDDMWINAMAYLKGTSIVKTDYYSHCLPIIYSDNRMLSTDNVDNGLNDKQINLIRTHYIRTISTDPYSKAFSLLT